MNTSMVVYFWTTWIVQILTKLHLTHVFYILSHSHLYSQQQKVHHVHSKEVCQDIPGQ